MANPPKGFWECPECGAFVDNHRRTCSDCGYYKSKAQVPLHQSSNPAEESNITGTIDSIGINPSEAGGGVCVFFTVIAWIIWIGGLIASFFLCRTEEYNRYKGTYYEYNIPLMIACYSAFLFSGALSMAIGRILSYLDIIASNTAKMKITLTPHTKE